MIHYPKLTFKTKIVLNLYSRSYTLFMLHILVIYAYTYVLLIAIWNVLYLYVRVFPPTKGYAQKPCFCPSEVLNPNPFYSLLFSSHCHNDHSFFPPEGAWPQVLSTHPSAALGHPSQATSARGLSWLKTHTCESLRKEKKPDL